MFDEFIWQFQQLKYSNLRPCRKSKFEAKLIKFAWLCVISFNAEWNYDISSSNRRSNICRPWKTGWFWAKNIQVIQYFFYSVEADLRLGYFRKLIAKMSTNRPLKLILGCRFQICHQNFDLRPFWGWKEDIKNWQFSRDICAFPKVQKWQVQRPKLRHLRHLVEKSYVMRNSTDDVFYDFDWIWVSKFSLGTPLYDVFIVILPLCPGGNVQCWAAKA